VAPQFSKTFPADIDAKDSSSIRNYGHSLEFWRNGIESGVFSLGCAFGHARDIVDRNHEASCHPRGLWDDNEVKSGFPKHEKNSLGHAQEDLREASPSSA
jgi:hypothetical protein